jgi:putative transposase
LLLPARPQARDLDRLFFEAALYRAHAGCLWRDLPEGFGNRSAIDNCLRHWLGSGRLKRLFGLMSARTGCEGIRQVIVDSTIVRAHQHGPRGWAVKGGRSAGDRPLARRALDEGHRRRGPMRQCPAGPARTGRGRSLGAGRRGPGGQGVLLPRDPRRGV